mgnify:CR=1 FL=1
MKDKLERAFDLGNGKEIVIQLGDITKIDACAIVNSENHDLVMDAPDGTSVSAAIRRRGGEELAARALLLGPLKPGEAVATGPGALPCKHLIHAAVVRLQGENRWTSASLIRRSTLATLRCATKLKCETLAIPAFGVGTARFPDRAAARIMIRTVIDYLRGRTSLHKVVIAMLTPATFITFFERSLEETLRQIPRVEVSVEARQGQLHYRFTDDEAASLTHRATVSAKTRQEVAQEAHNLFSRSGPQAVHREELEELGTRWASILLPPAVTEALKSHSYGSLLFRHAPALASLPWELLHDSEGHLCQRFNMARQVMVRDDGALRSKQKKGGGLGRLVIVADPLEDLPSAAGEGSSLLQLDESGEGALVAELLAGKRATCQRVMRQIHGASAVHFCGHGDLTITGGWQLADGLLKPRALGSLRPPPAIVFNNCCPPVDGPHDDGTALGQAVLRAGVSAYLSASYPPPDEAARAFGLHFWRYFAEGAGPAEAVRRARELLAQRESRWGASWACYVLFGNPILL